MWINVSEKEMEDLLWELKGRRHLQKILKREQLRAMGEIPSPIERPSEADNE